MHTFHSIVRQLCYSCRKINTSARKSVLPKRQISSSSSSNICHSIRLNRRNQLVPAFRFSSAANSATVSQTHKNEPKTDTESALAPGKKVEELDPELLRHLERTSLVGFGSDEAVSRLQEAIKFAEILQEVDVNGVEPMYTVLENINLRTRPDEVETTSREDILRNASIAEDDYFVAPPGNVPLDPGKLK